MPLVHIEVRFFVRTLELWGTIASIWPPPVNAALSLLIVRDIVWGFNLINGFMVFYPLVYSLYVLREEKIAMMKPLCELCALMEVLLDLLICRIERPRLQILVTEVMDFCNYCNNEERSILQRYVDRYFVFTISIVIIYFLGAIMFSFAPLFMHTQLPGDAIYPFSIESTSLRAVIYVSDVILIFEIAFCLTVDLMIAMFLWYPAARLEILGCELLRVEDERQLRICAMKHQKILNFVSTVQGTVANLIFKTNVTMGITAITGILSLLYHHQMTVVMQFLCLIFAGYQRLYTTAKPADDLKEMSEQLATSVYSASWVGKTSNMMKDVCIMMLRSQKPIFISMGGLLPALTLQYYANFFYTISSYFMTMKTVVGG